MQSSKAAMRGPGLRRIENVYAFDGLLFVARAPKLRRPGMDEWRRQSLDEGQK
jgi:hypothetical protein